MHSRLFKKEIIKFNFVLWLVANTHILKTALLVFFFKYSPKMMKAYVEKKITSLLPY